jgi:Glutaredoxin
VFELFQTEWCPASRHVRQRLTELGVDCISRQVPVEREARIELRAATGADENIFAYLAEQFVEPLEAEAQRQKAAKARRRYLEDECQCLQPVTR